MTKSFSACVVRVFVDEKGKFGNPVGIIVDEKREINRESRQQIAVKLGFSESVFINNLTVGDVSIYNPKQEVDFAGHALVGTAYFINKTSKQPIKSLMCRLGIVKTWQEDGRTFIHASLKGTPPWHHEQLQDPSQVETLSKSKVASYKHTIVWSWLDQDKNIVRARTFAPDWGIPEDQANGSGSMQLAAMLGRSLEIHHGEGSVIYANPSGFDSAEVGGRTKEDPPRTVEL